MKRYLNMPDSRERDVWGKPVGPRYENKDWDQLTPEEMMADFEWKSDVLAAFGEEIGGDTFYQDYLFRELYNGELAQGYKVILTEYDAEAGSKVNKIDVEEISDFLQKNDVALSPCLFHGNWRKKALLNYVSAFVLDIDKLRPENLKRFFQLFDGGRLLRPTFIANSGSGVHFYYLLDQMLRVDPRRYEANNLIAEEIYKRLYDDVIKKEKWVDAQRHWIGQDYRVVNSKTKLDQVSQIFMVGDVYRIEDLIAHYEIKVDPTKHYATKGMVRYANSIAKDLKIYPPDYTNAKETYNFIRDHKDEAFMIRANRRAERIMKDAIRMWKYGPRTKPVTWYRNTLAYMQDHTTAGHRFSAMKALAIIAYKEQVPREVFVRDLNALADYWTALKWKGDKFNRNNVEAVIRLFDAAAPYGNTSSETLEEWLGYEFKRVGVKRNGRSRADHIKVMNAMKRTKRELGEAINEGRPSAEQTVKAYREAHPEAKKADCIRDTGLSKPTVYKWWNGEPAQDPTTKAVIQPLAPNLNEVIRELISNISDVPAEDRKKLLEAIAKTEKPL